MRHINQIISTYLFFPLLFALTLLLSSCSQHKLPEKDSVLSVALTQTAAQYLQQAQQATGNNQIDWLLLAANASLKEKNNTQAMTILQQLATRQLNQAQQQEYHLTQAMLAYFQQDAKSAQQALAQVDLSQLVGVQRYHYFLVQVYLTSNQPIQQVRAYIGLEKTAVNVTEQHQIIDATWQALNKVTSKDLENIVVNANEVTLQGWLNLWLVVQHDKADFKTLQTGVINWQSRYPSNPAASYLPRKIFAPYFTLPTDNSGLKVALFLPLSGKYQAVGKSILFGFEQAMLGNALALPSPASATVDTVTPSTDSTTTPVASTNTNTTDINNVTPEASSSSNELQSQQFKTLLLQQEITQHLKIYDTNGTSIEKLVNEAEQAGVQLIIGPFLSQNVAQIENIPVSLPILALNSPVDLKSSNQMCYFSISPEAEAHAAAEYIYQQGKRLPLVLAPNNTLGHKIANIFAKTWYKESGDTALGQFFPNKTALSQLMNKGIGINIDGKPLLPAPNATVTPLSSTNNAVSSNSTADSAVAAAPNATATPLSSTNNVVSSNGTAGSAVAAAPNATATPLSSTNNAISSNGPAGSAVATATNIDAVYLVASKDQLLLLKPMLEMLAPAGQQSPKIASKKLPQIYMSSFGRQQDEGADFNLEMNNIIFSDIPLLSNEQSSTLDHLPDYIKDNYSLVRAYALGFDAWSLANNYTQLQTKPNYQLQGETGQLTTGKNCILQWRPLWQKYSNGKIVSLQ